MMRSAQGVPHVSPTVDRVLRLLDVSYERACRDLDESERSGPRADMAGRRLRLRGLSAVYLVDPAGYRRRIPSQAVHDRLFRDGALVAIANVGDIAPRPPLAESTMLVRGAASSVIHLLDQGRKRRVAGPSAMAKYSFDWDRVCVVRQVLIDSLPCGADWG
jgi:hypothetical protein